MEQNNLSRSTINKMIKESESLILITVEDGNVFLSFSGNLDQMSVLDLLSLVTAEFYANASETGNSVH